MTPAGYQALTEELRQRSGEERPRIIAAISEARAHGDLSENASITQPRNSRASMKAAFPNWKTSSLAQKSSMFPR